MRSFLVLPKSLLPDIEKLMAQGCDLMIAPLEKTSEGVAIVDADGRLMGAYAEFDGKLFRSSLVFPNVAEAELYLKSQDDLEGCVLASVTITVGNFLAPLPQGVTQVQVPDQHGGCASWDLEPDIYCPNCGHKGVWVGGVDDYYVGETHCCVACECSFCLPGGCLGAKDKPPSIGEEIARVRKAVEEANGQS